MKYPWHMRSSQLAQQFSHSTTRNLVGDQRPGFPMGPVKLTGPFPARASGPQTRRPHGTATLALGVPGRRTARDRTTRAALPVGGTLLARLAQTCARTRCWGSTLDRPGPARIGDSGRQQPLPQQG